MNGAQSLIRTLVDAGVDTCFMNPGTSEMHFVAALDDVPEMRGVLALFEGVATGAADGYARMADRPASVLLHLGPGLGNGLANLHNARKGKVPVVNVVGDHATYHKRYNAQLELSRVGVQASGPKAKEMLDLHGPDLDFVQIAGGMGVPATRATTAEEFCDQFERAVKEPGPSLIDAVVPSLL
jgi:thiamine pyrophosphate-dependent acetolactate synthase large subunit-like protein